jgi:acyl-CoA hydrolase
VTAAIDEIAFIEPVRIGDLVHAHAQVNWTGTTSMEMGVRLVAERWDREAIQAYRDTTGPPQP